MKCGIGTVKCGKCLKSMPVAWGGAKYKIPCFYCGASMTIHRTRLKNFQPIRHAGGRT